MKTLLPVLLIYFLPGNSTWLTNLYEAKQLAKTNHEYILLNFSGSEWCSPCIRMHTGIFENDIIGQYPDAHLILVNAGFPNLRKNKLASNHQNENGAIADNYNPKVFFPYSLLLDTDGKVLKTWNGFFSPGGQIFTEQIRNTVKTKSE